MGKIYCIMGKSSSGKDTIYKELLKDKELGLRRIIPYTTRPIRQGEKNGQEYFFIDNQQLEKLKQENRIVEMRTYHTCLGDWNYLTVHDKEIEISKQNYLMIGTPEAFLSIRSYYGKDRVIPILIELDDGTRLQRALNREKMQKQPKYDEMCRRFLADQKDFSEGRLNACEITARFCNDELEICIEKIKQYILQEQ